MCIRILFASVEIILALLCKKQNLLMLVDYFFYCWWRMHRFNYYISFSPLLHIAFGYYTAIVINEFILVTDSYKQM